MQKFPFEAEALKVWFQKEGRALPWRKDPTPYAVWVSEIMLQQTQVAVVVDYFLRWMARFPTIEVLAASAAQDVIKMWEGLGFYSRARNLHAAAQHIALHHNGVLPSTHAELSAIKGIGSYTAGAIRSFAFKQKAAAVDGNVLRVLARYFAIEEDIRLGSTRKKIWEIAEGILPEQEPWLVTEGLIELGATVCSRNPKCWSCPIRSGCAAFCKKRQEELPKIGKKVEITPLFRNVFVVLHQREVLLRKAEEGKVMAGLYEFPYADKKQKGFPFLFDAKKLQTLPEVTHSFTRYRVKLYPTVWMAADRVQLPEGEYIWTPLSQIPSLPFSSGHKRILKHLEALLYARLAH